MRRSNMWAGDYRAERRPHLNAEQSDSFFFLLCVSSVRVGEQPFWVLSTAVGGPLLRR